MHVKLGIFSKKENLIMFKKLHYLVIVFVALLPFRLTTFAATTFTDVTMEARLGDKGLGIGVVCGDYDDDGDLDLYVVRGGWGELSRAPDTLYRNDGGTFTKDEQLKHANSGLDGVFVDYDNDSDLDFWLSTKEGIFLHRNLGKGAFSNDITAETGLRVGLGAFTTAFGDYDKDGYLDIYLGIGGSNRLYRNNGNGTFADVTAQAKVGDKRQSFSVHFFDYDNDGYLDIHVLNAEGRFVGIDNTDLLYRNNGDGTFTEVGDKAGVRHIGSGRCAISGDYDNDGDLDLLLGGRRYNVFYQNNGDGTFTDVTKEIGLNPSLSGEAACFGDYDNDGYLDLFVTRWKQLNSLYHNNGDGTFTEVTQKAGLAVEGLISSGTIFFDYDNDGALDIFVATYSASQRLYRSNSASQRLYRNNGTENNWFQVKLIGTESNRDGIGARVKTEAGNLRMMREISSGSFRVHPSLTAHFGVGNNKRVDKIEVHWPSGEVDVLNDIPANQVIVIKEGVGLVESREFKNFTTKDGLPHNSVNTIYCDPDGILWFGTIGGVSRYATNNARLRLSAKSNERLRLTDGKEFTNFTTTDGLSDHDVLVIHRDSNGTMWFGTQWGGVFRYSRNNARLRLNDGKKFKNFTRITAIHRDSNGIMWFGTFYGASCYDGKQFKTFTAKDGLPNSWINCIYSDPDDMLWFGTAGGVSRYDGKEFKNFTISESVSNVICSLNHDTYGNFWIGTYAGVFRYNGKDFIPEGEFTVAFNAIYQASDGMMWFGTDIMGVAGYDGVAWTLLDKRDGLAGDSVRSIAEDAEGYLWFGTNGGITRYRRSKTKPKVHIVSVTTDREYTDFEVMPPIKTGNRITLKYSAIDPKTRLEKQQYRYRIKEIDDDWGHPTKETSFEDYFDKAGSYTFEVQAIDRDLNYSEPASVTLKVLPPFYVSSGFLIPTVSIGTILIALLTFLSIGYIKRRRQVQAYQRAAVEELRDANRVQMSLMPVTAPPIEGVEIAGKCIPANTVSGDFFDYLEGKQPNEIVFVVADVTGKAMKGAMNAVMTNGILHTTAREQEHFSPASLMITLNDVLKARTEPYMNVTMVIGLLDASTQNLTLANAAHHAYPLLLHAGNIQTLKTGGLPLGVRAGIQYREEQFSLQSGDVLILMTDGIIEAQDSEGRMYAESGRLEGTIGKFTQDMSPESMVDAVINDAIAFGDSKTQRDDDMTVVVAKVL